jgi:hypothetical protein
MTAITACVGVLVIDLKTSKVIDGQCARQARGSEVGKA